MTNYKKMEKAVYFAREKMREAYIEWFNDVHSDCKHRKYRNAMDEYYRFSDEMKKCH